MNKEAIKRLEEEAAAELVVDTVDVFADERDYHQSEPKTANAVARKMRRVRFALSHYAKLREDERRAFLLLAGVMPSGDRG
jgi:hypothetical protein